MQAALTPPRHLRMTTASTRFRARQGDARCEAAMRRSSIIPSGTPCAEAPAVRRLYKRRRKSTAASPLSPQEIAERSGGAANGPNLRRRHAARRIHPGRADPLFTRLVEGTTEHDIPTLPLRRLLSAMPGERCNCPDQRGQRGYLKRAGVQRPGPALFYRQAAQQLPVRPDDPLVLPNAKIIDARRTPSACCFSNFRQHYARGQLFTYGLGDMGRYYVDYTRSDGPLRQCAPGPRPSHHLRKGRRRHRGRGADGCSINANCRSNRHACGSSDNERLVGPRAPNRSASPSIAMRYEDHGGL